MTPDAHTSESVALANAAVAATPTPVELARALGEENFVGDEHGKFEVRAVDKHGAPDMKKARLLREMFQERNRLEQKLSDVQSGPPVIVAPPAPARLSFGPPRGGWPVFGKDGRVVG